MKKSGQVKNFIARYVVPMAITVCILSVFFYFQRGIPLVRNLEKRQEIISVRVTQGGSSARLSDEQTVQQAARMVQMLSYRFGKPQTGPAETVYVFEFRDGSVLELGVNETTVFKNGKPLRGNAEFNKMFSEFTEAIFLSGRGT